MKQLSVNEHLARPTITGAAATTADQVITKGEVDSGFVPKRVAVVNTAITYNVTAADDERTVVHTNAGAVVVTIPTGLAVGHQTLHVAAGAGGLSLTTTGNTLVGNAPATSTTQNGTIYVEVSATDTLIVDAEVAPGPAGTITITQTTIDIGATATVRGLATVTNAGVSGASKIFVNWGAVTAASRNHPEFDRVTFLAIPGAGNFTVQVLSDTPISGPFNIQYIVS